MVQVIHQEYDPQGRIQKCKTGTCLLYRVNEIGTVIVIVYVYDTLSIRDKSELVNMIELIKK